MNRRATFGPVVLLGLGGAALAAVAGNKPWTEVQAENGECGLGYGLDFQFAELAQGAPLAGALALVALAAWGVLLVTRGVVRRVVAVLATLASAGFLATAVWAYRGLKATTYDLVESRLGPPAAGCDGASVWMNNTWWPAALAAGVLLVLAGVLAAWLVPAWPEMGTRYDAPAGAAATPADPASRSNLDLWKQLDEGHDPTVGDDGPPA